MLKTVEHNVGGAVEATAELQHISGPFRGTTTPLLADDIIIRLDEDRRITAHPFAADRVSEPADDAIAWIRRVDDGYALKGLGDRRVWVNGREFQAGQLIHKDIVEFGETGPLSRFWLCGKSKPRRRLPGEICADCWDYFRSSRKQLSKRLAIAAGDGLQQMLTRTTLIFRISVIALFIATGAAIYLQHELNTVQQRQLTDIGSQAEQIARSLLEAQELAAADLEGLKTDTSDRLAKNAERLDQLERSATATIDAIRKAAPSVVFLQGAYGLQEAETGRIVRHIVDSTGEKQLGPGGRPLLTMSGDGPPLENQFTGTGFAVADGTVIATNRHVAVPWTGTGGTVTFGGRQMQPFIIRFVAYLPGRETPVEVELIEAGDEVDLSLVRLLGSTTPLSPLQIAAEPPEPGSPVSVLGYPTGLHSMVAGAGRGFLEELRRSGNSEFWQVAARLAEEGRIQPLSSFGIVAQRTGEFLVYDAATTKGGSGGPVLNVRGEVVAINTAILQQYDGSNFGVPASELVRLLVRAGLAPGQDSNQG